METEKSFGQSEQFRVTLAENESKTKRATSSWSPSEKRQLRDFLATRHYLSWSRIAREYEERYHKERSSSSIAGQAHSMGISPRNKNRKSRGKLGRREHLVLKVPSVPSATKNASSMESLPDDSLRPPSASALEKANIKETPPQHSQVQKKRIFPWHMICPTVALSRAIHSTTLQNTSNVEHQTRLVHSSTRF